MGQLVMLSVGVFIGVLTIVYGVSGLPDGVSPLWVVAAVVGAVVSAGAVGVALAACIGADVALPVLAFATGAAGAAAT